MLYLLCVTHENHQSLDKGFEVGRNFRDISKASDKVWHKDLIFKLKQNGVVGDLLNSLTDTLKERKQRVVLNGEHSRWSSISTRAPKWSILVILPFLIYINDLSENLSSNTNLFADDTSLFRSCMIEPNLELT